jgi:uncharacterized protein YaaR (DUF327 family)
MDKVDPLLAGMGALPSLQAEKKEKRKPGLTPDDVRAKLTAGVASLITEVDKSGHELTVDPTGRHLERYKRAVRGLLDAAVTETMQVSSERSVGLSRKVFSTITRVDLALAEMTDAVLGRQQDMAKITSLVEQIKGLLVDLYR